MVSGRSAIPKVLYGALFTAVIPASLVLWARGAAAVVPLRPVRSLPAGLALLAAGIALIVAGGYELIGHGRGLPMNAFPPPILVRRGVFRWIRNPMYIGFTLAVAGASVATASASGLWLVTPIVGLASAALIFGYERHDLERRFGLAALEPPLLSLPRGNGSPPTAADRAAVVAWVLAPWAIVYFAVQAQGRPPDAFHLGFSFERDWPVVQWHELFYASTYVFVPLTPFLIHTRAGLRRFALTGIVATVVVGLVWVTIPVVASNRPFTPAGALGSLLAFEQSVSRGVAAFPAFHVLWSLIAADAWASNVSSPASRAWGMIGWSWALLIGVSCLTTGMHTVPEVAAAVALFVPLRRVERVAEAVRRAAESVANSWKEWRLGGVRIINHAVWAAAAAGVGLVVAGSAGGEAQFVAVLWVALWVLAGAGLWAQALEGSSKLLRPFGWYGGLVGGVAGGVSAPLISDSARIVSLLAAFAIAAPWIQIFGRLRCLVNGCCHGAPTSGRLGIRYRHRRSRVTAIAHLADVPIYPTPVYSIVANLLIGIALVRLRLLGAPDSLVLGIYLMLGGIARFVEESYRGEPQTPILRGLRVYQWMAILSLVIGIACTAVRPTPAPMAGFAGPSRSLLLAAVAMALLTAFAMGVDFPRSNRRFSRLAASD